MRRTGALSCSSLREHDSRRDGYPLFGMRSSCSRPRVPVRTALTAIVLAAALVQAAPAAAAKPGHRVAAMSAAAPAELALTASASMLRYGRTLTLTAKLTSGGAALGAREVVLYRNGAQAAKAQTRADGVVVFKLKPNAASTYQAGFSPATPADVAAYQPAASVSVSVTVAPLVRLRLSSPLRAGRSIVGIPGEPIRISGTLAPFASGSVVVRVLKGGRQFRRSSRAVAARGGRGRFGFSFTPRRRGKYVIEASRQGDATLARGRAQAKRVLVVRASARQGSKGAGVRALQRRLSALGYATPINGSFGASTARAVLAFRKVRGMGRNFSAGRSIFRTLERGGGAFRLRDTKPGKHVEFDWSRQVLVLARGSQVVRIVHGSSGAPVTPTVFGRFHFYRKSPGFNAKGMYFSNYFIGGYAIHGYQSVPNFPASHGCIRIPIASATAVYRWIDVGDRISVYK